MSNQTPDDDEEAQVEEEEEEEEDSVTTEDLPSINRDLRGRGDATRADGECSDCNGALWNVGRTEVICENCSVLVSSGNDVPWYSKPELRLDNDDRSTYNNSERRRCAGGFPHTYDWVKSSEIDDSVRDVNPSDFYK